MKLKCPECDSSGPFKAMVAFLVTTYEDSRVEDLDLYTPIWEFDAHMECLECGFEGARQDFYDETSAKTVRIKNNKGQYDEATIIPFDD